MKGKTYFGKESFSINEGGTPINFHFRWRRDGKLEMFAYIYFFGFRWWR